MKNKVDEKETKDENHHNFIIFLASFSIISSLIGLALGFSFQNIIKEFVNGIIMPIIQFFVGKKNKNLSIPINGDYIHFGPFISSIIQFVFVAFIIYLVVWKIFKKPINEIVKARNAIHITQNEIAYQNFLKLQSLDNKIKKPHPYEYDEILPPNSWYQTKPQFINKQFN